MNDAEARDVLRDVIALVAANVHDDPTSATLSLRVIRKRDDEDVVDWIERVSMLVDLLASTAAVFLARWSDHLTLSEPDLMRVFAEQLEATSTALDLAGGDNNTNEGN